MSVITNVSKPESTPKKKWNAICYHAVEEPTALGEAIVAHISMKKNVADLFTTFMVRLDSFWLTRCSGMCSLVSECFEALLPGSS